MYDEDGYYVVLTDPEVERDPYFDGMSMQEVWAELDRLEREQAEGEQIWEREQLEYELMLWERKRLGYNSWDDYGY